ncbi:MAG: D-Ala-D-Ala carboxypeptidase family metallohydrolase [Nitrospinaceae bacterium]
METQKYAHWEEVISTDWHWPHFSPQELACKHIKDDGTVCGELVVNPEALDKLEEVRTTYRRPIVIASAYRCKNHKSGSGPHGTGAAFDAYPAERGDLAEMEDAFFFVGVLGRGKGKVDGKGHLHFDWDHTRGRRSWYYGS